MISVNPDFLEKSLLDALDGVLPDLLSLPALWEALGVADADDLVVSALEEDADFAIDPDFAGGCAMLEVSRGLLSLAESSLGLLLDLSRGVAGAGEAASTAFGVFLPGWLAAEETPACLLCCDCPSVTLFCGAAASLLLQASAPPGCSDADGAAR